MRKPEPWVQGVTRLLLENLMSKPRGYASPEGFDIEFSSPGL